MSVSFFPTHSLVLLGLLFYYSELEQLTKPCSLSSQLTDYYYDVDFCLPLLKAVPLIVYTFDCVQALLTAFNVRSEFALDAASVHQA